MFNRNLDSDLSIAIKNQNADIVGLLLKRGAKLNTNDIIQLFYTSTSSKRLKKHCYSNYDSPSDFYEETNIRHVSTASYWINLLIEHKAVNIQNPGTGDTVLMWACDSGQDDLVKKLLAAKADPSLCNNKQQDALHIAVKENATKCVELLCNLYETHDRFEDAVCKIL